MRRDSYTIVRMAVLAVVIACMVGMILLAWV